MAVSNRNLLKTLKKMTIDLEYETFLIHGRRKKEKENCRSTKVSYKFIIPDLAGRFQYHFDTEAYLLQNVGKYLQVYLKLIVEEEREQDVAHSS
jgi:hypothetical protein